MLGSFALYLLVCSSFLLDLKDVYFQIITLGTSKFLYIYVTDGTRHDILTEFKATSKTEFAAHKSVSLHRYAKHSRGFEEHYNLISGLYKSLDKLRCVIEVIEPPPWNANLNLKQEPTNLPRNRLLHWGPIFALSITFYVSSRRYFVSVLLIQ